MITIICTYRKNFHTPLPTLRSPMWQLLTEELVTANFASRSQVLYFSCNALLPKQAYLSSPIWTMDRDDKQVIL